MAGKKSVKGGDPEVVSALTETTAVAEKNPEAVSAAVEDPAAADPQEQEVPMEEAAGEPDIFSDEDPLTGLEEQEGKDPKEESREAGLDKKLFKITCRNSVSEVIGGVMFVAGVGYTRDAYAASWFANKAGYRVDLEG